MLGICIILLGFLNTHCLSFVCPGGSTYIQEGSLCFLSTYLGARFCRTSLTKTISLPHADMHTSPLAHTTSRFTFSPTSPVQSAYADAKWRTQSCVHIYYINIVMSVDCIILLSMRRGFLIGKAPVWGT